MRFRAGFTSASVMMPFSTWRFRFFSMVRTDFFDRFLLEIVESDVVAAEGDDVRDAGAHLAGADDADLLDGLGGLVLAFRLVCRFDRHVHVRKSFCPRGPCCSDYWPAFFSSASSSGSA